MTADTFATAAMWAGFITFVLAMIALDLFVLGGHKAHRVSVRRAGGWVAAWVSMAPACVALLWWHLNTTAGRELADREALEFITGYLIEQPLSVDNMFVFVMILAGVWLVQEFAWMLQVFGAFLVVTGIKMLIFANHAPDLAANPLLGWLRRHTRITPAFPGEKFWGHIDGKMLAAPWFHLPVQWAPGVVGAVPLASVLPSLRRSAGETLRNPPWG